MKRKAMKTQEELRLNKSRKQNKNNDVRFSAENPTVNKRANLARCWRLGHPAGNWDLLRGTACSVLQWTPAERARYRLLRSKI